MKQARIYKNSVAFRDHVYISLVFLVKWTQEGKGGREKFKYTAE